MMPNSLFLRFAATFIKKDYKKHLLTFSLFSFLVAILFSLLFVSTSLKGILKESLVSAPDIRVTPQKGGYDFFATDAHIDALSRIRGVGEVEGRVFGRYFFSQADTYFYVAGVDFYKESGEDLIKRIVSGVDINTVLDDDFILIGSRVKEKMRGFHYEEHFNFFLPDNKLLKLNIIGTIDKNPIHENIIITGIQNARAILGLKDNEYSDIGLYVPNETELPTIVLQIKELFPNAKVVLKSDTRSYYQYLFYYKGGIFMIFYIVVLLSFFILLYQKISAILGSEKRELAIFKAIGWSIGDIIRFQLLIHFTLSFLAFCLGLFAAYIYVYLFGAPLFVNIFLQHTQSIALIPGFEMSDISMVFLFTVIPYMAATIIPSWKASIVDVEETLR